MHSPVCRRLPLVMGCSSSLAKKLCCASCVICCNPFCAFVLDGPDRPHIITQPDSPFHVAGSTIRLTCFTESRPGAKLNWQLNGAHLHSGQEVILDSISVSNAGKYTCEAYNTVTKRINASTTQIIVFEAVTGVAVVANDSTPLENLDTIALSCDASGTVQTRTWSKDNQPIQENGRIFTSPDKAKLTIISVNRNDAGTYKCIASNSFSNGAGETYVQVYYGPEKVRIVPKRPVVSNIVSNLTLACFALSVPYGEYTWYNGNNLLQTGQELTLVSVSSVDVGSYTCRVTNGVTNRNSYLTVHVTAQATKADDNITLTTGAIVGIALGLLGMGLIGGVSGWLIARKTGRVKNSPPPQYETSSNFGRNSTLDTKTVNASPSYVNFPRNEQGGVRLHDERRGFRHLEAGDKAGRWQQCLPVRKSCLAMLLEFLEEITCAIGNKESEGGVRLDFQKAFNKLTHIGPMNGVAADERRCRTQARRWSREALAPERAWSGYPVESLNGDNDDVDQPGDEHGREKCYSRNIEIHIRR
ncbi:cell adhesion molecule CEACAM20-like [Hemitrygon akajei]|uniref:cell adhesion molecule CEACAM20-like n=1 Tax=Hemitrygon akajei TaxID=2704970 RepID=UPI003BF9DD30